jgi:hypothetical protein
MVHHSHITLVVLAAEAEGVGQVLEQSQEQQILVAVVAVDT